MKPYIVRIVETYSKSVIIWADDAGEALNIADNLYDTEEIDLSRNCYDGAEKTVDGIAKESELDDYDQYDSSDVGA